MKPYINKTYLLDSNRVKASVDTQVKRYEEMRKLSVINSIALMRKWKIKPTDFSRRPQSPVLVRKMYKSWIDLELIYYAKVRVVRTGTKKWLLVFGDADDTTIKSGTGPFKTLAKAQEWFFKQGR